MSENAEVVPRNDQDIAQLLGERPDGWEYMLYAGILLIGVEQLEAQYSDFSLGYAPRSGAVIPQAEFIHYIQAQLTELQVIISVLNNLFSDEVMTAAVGAPGVEGDADKIIHAAKRVVRLYEDLLQWAQRIRSMAMPDKHRQVADTLVRFSSQPINELRDFTHRFAARINALPAAITSGEPIKIVEQVTFAIPNELVQEFNRSLEVLK